MIKPISVITGLLGVAVAFVYFTQTSGELKTAPGALIESNADAERSQSAIESSSQAHDVRDEAADLSNSLTDDLNFDDASFEELNSEMLVAVADREKAEEAMRVVEMKLSALESQLDDIELRGDDPADVQDETLGTFQAIFAEYQDKIILYEQASAKEKWIEAKVDGANE